MSEQDMDGIGANGFHSYKDFGLQFATAPELSSPETNRVTVTPPYFNGVLEFTEAMGQPYKGTRTLKCEWEIDGDDQRMVEARRSEVENWLGRIVDDDITYDTLPEGFHLHGTMAGCTPSYEEYGDKLTLEVEFELYPFMIADEPTTQTLQTGTTTVLNSGWPVRLTATPTGSKATIEANGVKQTITAETELHVPFETGANKITVTDGAVVLKWTEEMI